MILFLKTQHGSKTGKKSKVHWGTGLYMYTLSLMSSCLIYIAAASFEIKKRKAKSGNNRNHTKIMTCIHNNSLHVWDSLAFSITFITIIIIMRREILFSVSWNHIQPLSCKASLSVFYKVLQMHAYEFCFVVILVSVYTPTLIVNELQLANFVISLRTKYSFLLRLIDWIYSQPKGYTGKENVCSPQWKANYFVIRLLTINNTHVTVIAKT